MGLDMYMDRVKKIDGMTVNEIFATADYIDYLNRPSKYSSSSFEQWCGRDEDEVRKDKINDVKARLHTTYGAWDLDKEYGCEGVSDGVAYWRKANAIHKWFVDNCGDGIDECQTMEVSKEKLEELLDTAQKVKDSCVLVDGEIQNGYRFINGKEVPIMVKGKYIKDFSVAEELLPVAEGFFFGSTKYDEWYFENIESTIEQISEILKTTD